MPGRFTPDGSNLGITRLVRYARDPGTVIGLCDAGLERMRLSRRIVDDAITHSRPVYGLTTGLGSRVTEPLTPEQLSGFPIQTLRGRAQAIGEPLTPEVTRGAMIVRLNTMMSGASGATPALAEHLQVCLNRSLVPVVGATGSIGVSDLCMGATMGMALIGEGEMWLAGGRRRSAAEALRQAGVPPVGLKPGEGLVLASHAAFSASMSTFSIAAAGMLYNCLQACAAMSMEAIGTGCSVIEMPVIALQQHGGQQRAAAHLRNILAGGGFLSGNRGGRIQDPLSIRNAVQAHGSLLSALDDAFSAVNAELNSVSDNPVVDLKNRRIVPSGGYFSSQLLLVLELVARGLDLAMVMQVARISKLLGERFSGLPQYLVRPASDSNGFAPVLKVAEALLANAKRQLAPVVLWPSISADGMEDVLTNAFERADALHRAVRQGFALSAIELMIAAQALDLSGRLDTAGTGIRSIHGPVRERVPELTTDRSVSDDIRTLACALESGAMDLPDWREG